MLLLFTAVGSVLVTAGAAFVLFRVNERRHRGARDDAHAQRLRLHAGLSAADVATFSVSPDGMCRWYEGAQVPGTDVGRSEMLGRSAWHTLAPWPGVVAELRRALGGHRVEARVRVGQAWLDCTCAPRFGDNGKLTEVVAVLRDASAAQEHVERIERLSEVRSRTLAVMNQRMRVQLSTLQGALHLARNDHSESSSWLDTASEAGTRLATFVEHLVDFLELDAGRMTLVSRPFSLRDLVAEVRERYEPLATRDGSTLVVRYPMGALDEVEGDAARIHQLIDLTLGTALRTNRGRQVVLNIDATSAGATHAALAISVEDNGRGLSADARARAFEAFNAASAMWAIRSGGSGLELPIAGRLATLLGGAIEIESRPGTGTSLTARFELERAWGVGHRTEGDGAPRRALPAARVLLVDDDATSREVMAAVLAGLGQVVQTAEHGGAALDALRYAPFDVVLTELHMPVLGGLGVLEAALALPEPPAVIVHSADTRPESRDKVVAAGALYLAKPATVPSIKRVLAAALATRGAGTGVTEEAAEALPGLERLRQQGPEGATMADELVEAFLESSDQLMLAVSDAVARRDTPALEATLPLLETSSRLLGSALLAATLDHVRDAIEDGDPEDVRAAAGGLAAEVRRLQRELASLADEPAREAA